jgi:hypothetical protein
VSSHKVLLPRLIWNTTYHIIQAILIPVIQI